MTVINARPEAEGCEKDIDPFISQDSENLLGEVLAGNIHLFIFIFINVHLNLMQCIFIFICIRFLNNPK